MLRSPQDLYAKLLSSAYGYPLWNPKPSDEFLIKRPEGLRIGDVGLVTPDDGGFDALFNLCLPRDHCFHTRYGVPDSFTCIRPEELEISTDFSAEPPGQVISTPSVTRVGTVSSTGAPRRDMSGVSTYRFNLSSDEGALLILPEGAERCQLLNDGLFVQKASQNAAEWYSYAVNRRHRIISQDSLYIITGLHKSRSWSVTAFENVAGNESCAAHYKHIPDGGSTNTPACGWETVRASFRWRAGTSIDYVMPSQSVFIRGLKITLRDGFLGSTRISVKANTPFSALSTHRKSLIVRVIPSNSWVRDTLARLRLRTDGGHTSQNTMHTERSADAANEQAENTSDLGGYEGMHAEIQRVPNVPPAFHPSNAINQYLLRKDPSANIAITCDGIWMWILEEKLLTTAEFDQDSSLEKVLSQNFDIISHEGVVRLEREGVSTADRQTHPLAPRISDPNSASDNALQDAESRAIAKFPSITSRMGSSCEQPLSPSPRASFNMPDSFPQSNMAPHSTASNLANSGLEQSLRPASAPDQVVRSKDLQNPSHSPETSIASTTLVSTPQASIPKMSRVPPPASQKRHIIFIGQSGSGRSSVINLIAGRDLARVPSRPARCARDFTQYEVCVEEMTYILWDTPGVDEQLSVSKSMFKWLATSMTSSLKKFLDKRYRSKELDLLVLCAEGKRVGKDLATYRDFCAATRQMGIPVVIVVTFLNYKPPTMDSWWHEYERRFQDLGLIFDGRACVTCRPGHPSLWASQKELLRSLLSTVIRNEPTSQEMPTEDTSCSVLTPKTDSAHSPLCHDIIN